MNSSERILTGVLTPNKIIEWVLTCGFALFGCNPHDGLLVGAFACTVDYAVSHSAWYRGVSLNY